MEFARENVTTTSFRETYINVGLLLKAILLSTLVAISGVAIAERDTSRDQYRHPMETLAFFGIIPQMDVLEISPGGGWYTELLADYVTGNLLAGHYDPQSDRAYYRNSQGKFAAKIAASPELYGNVEMHIFDAAAKKLSAEDSSVDAVVTFRNVHNWMGSNTEASSFGLFFDALKPGGVLGVVEHRAPAGTDKATMQKSGYMTQDYVIELARGAGFIFEASSEVNANKKDTANHPKGVWTLPPSFSLGDRDRELYEAIGESDRMTLRFRKPSQ